MSKYQDALNAYLEGVKKSGRNPDTREACDIGNLFLKVGNPVQGRRWLEAALAATSAENTRTRADILAGLVAAYLAQKEAAALEGAVAELDKIAPGFVGEKYPQLHEQLAEFRRKLKEAEDALKAAELKKSEEAKKAEEEKRLAEEKNPRKRLPKRQRRRRKARGSPRRSRRRKPPSWKCRNQRRTSGSEKGRRQVSARKTHRKDLRANRRKEARGGVENRKSRGGGGQEFGGGRGAPSPLAYDAEGRRSTRTWRRAKPMSATPTT